MVESVARKQEKTNFSQRQRWPGLHRRTGQWSTEAWQAISVRGWDPRADGDQMAGKAAGKSSLRRDDEFHGHFSDSLHCRRH